MQEQQVSRVVIQGSRIEYLISCDWCVGHGYEPTEFGTVEACSECHGSGFKFHYVMEGNDGN